MIYNKDIFAQNKVDKSTKSVQKFNLIQNKNVTQHGQTSGSGQTSSSHYPQLHPSCQLSLSSLCPPNVRRHTTLQPVADIRGGAGPAAAWCRSRAEAAWYAEF